MRIFIIVFTLLSSQIFFSFMEILGEEYTGSENSDLYTIYRVIVFLLILILYLRGLIKRKK